VHTLGFEGFATNGIALMSPNLIQAVGIKYALGPDQKGFSVGIGDVLTDGLR